MGRPRIEPLEARDCPSVAVLIDYSLDTFGFFAAQPRRDLLQLAADTIASQFDDHLAAIEPSGDNSWSAVFVHPATRATFSVPNLRVPADTYVLYAGGTSALGGTLGIGGPGGFQAVGSQAFLDLVAARGQVGALGVPAARTDFGPWGGVVTFSTTANWYFGTDAGSLSSGQNDFLSVALHELAHAFGFGTADSFENRVVAGRFTGPRATAVYDFGGNPPLTANSHWTAGTTDDGQEAALTPSLLVGTRKLLTELDRAAFADLGWELRAATPPTLQFPSASSSVGEGDGRTTLTLLLSAPPSAAVTVPFTLSGTATLGTDYTASTNPLTIPAGMMVASIFLTPINDSTIETNETVVVTLGNPTNAVLGATTVHTATVVDDDRPNSPPTAVEDRYLLGSSITSSQATAGVLTNDSDPEGDPLTATLSSGTTLGTVTLAADGTFRYTPAATFWGVDTFTYRADDTRLTSPTRTVTLMTHTAAQVRKVYNQVLLREPDFGGWRFWTETVSRGVASLGVVASSIFESSERLDPIIRQYYRDFLLREADDGGLAFWRGVWQRDGGPENVVAGMASSPEFFQSAGGTNRGFVAKVYERVLRRDADVGGLDYWTAEADSGRRSRAGVVLGITTSREYYGNLVDGWYPQYLNRSPTATERGSDVERLFARLETQRATQIRLIDSAEYLNAPPPPAVGTAPRA